MGFGISIFLVAAGAILRYGLTRTTWGQLNLHSIGVIAMIIGVLGFIASTLVWAPWRTRATTTTVVDDPVVESTTTRRRVV